jgi:hypothetical protein
VGVATLVSKRSEAGVEAVSEINEVCAQRRHVRFSTKWCEHSDSNYNSKRERKKITQQSEGENELFVKETKITQQSEGENCL